MIRTSVLVDMNKTRLLLMLLETTVKDDVGSYVTMADKTQMLHLSIHIYHAPFPILLGIMVRVIFTYTLNLPAPNADISVLL